MMEYEWTDAYIKELARQNNGGVCSGCGSAIGHYFSCYLLTNEPSPAPPVPESTPTFNPTPEDFIRAHALGISLGENNASI